MKENLNGAVAQFFRCRTLLIPNTMNGTNLNDAAKWLTLLGKLTSQLCTLGCPSAPQLVLCLNSQPMYHHKNNHLDSHYLSDSLLHVECGALLYLEMHTT